MAIIDTSKKPYIEDRNENIFIGIEYPFRLSDGVEGYFKSTDTTLKAIKENIKNFIKTERGDRLFQPTLGLGLKRFLFENYNDALRLAIEDEIVSTFSFWMPFIEIKDIVINKDTDRNEFNIELIFNIKKDPTSLNSVQIIIGE